MSHEGFTEDDQTRIAEDLISRALGKGSRKGLGFGTDEADEEKEKDKGEAASKDKEKSRDKKRTREHREGGEERRPRSRSRERRRSRSRSRGRDRRGSRSRSRDGERDRKRSRRSSSRSRSRERRKRKDKDKGRSRSRSGSRSRASSRRSRSRDRSKDRDRRDDGRGRQEKVNKTKAEDGAPAHSQQQRQPQEGDPQAAVQSIAEKIRKKIEDAAAASQTDGKAQTNAAEPPQQEPVTSSQIQPAGLAEVIARLREKARGGLQQATSRDSDLQRTTTAGKQWERAEMTQASQYFKNEEVRETGTTADLDEQARRQRYIAAVEDEKVETLDGAVPVVRPTPAVAQTQKRPREEQGVKGGGVRTGPGRGKHEVDADDDDEPFIRTRDLPLWKRLKAGDVVEAKYSQDGKWYQATVKHVIHGGYPVAKYGVHYSAYGNEEEVSWRDIKLIEPADTPSPQRPQRSRTPSRSPSPVRGLIASKQTDERRKSSSVATPVELEQLINPALLNKKPGMSWKERAAAQRQALIAKSRSSGGDGSATNGVHVGLSCSEIASQIEKALDENKVNAYLTDKKRDKMQLNMKKSTSGRNLR